MSINSVNSVNGYNGSSVSGKYGIDPKEAEVARKLGMSPEEFSKLSETEKQAKVQAYNQTHPNDRIEDKQLPPAQQVQGTEMQQFMQDVDWKKIKLQ